MTEISEKNLQLFKFFRYIVKVTTYEVGILADVPDDDNATEDGPQTRQQVDLTFYDAQGNDSFLDFGDIPLPIQTNVSGHVITAITPVHIGTQNIENPLSIVNSIPITGTIVNITKSDSFINLSHFNVSLADQITHINDTNDLEQLPILNDVLLPENFHTVSNSLGKDAEWIWEFLFQRFLINLFVRRQTPFEFLIRKLT